MLGQILLGSYFAVHALSTRTLHQNNPMSPNGYYVIIEELVVTDRKCSACSDGTHGIIPIHSNAL